LRLRRLLPILIACLAFLVPGVAALADSNTAVLDALARGDVYISDQAYGHFGVKTGDLNRLQAAVNAAGARQVPEKIAILAHVPSNILSPAQAASQLRNYEDFAGSLIVVYPRGIGISSDTLSVSQETSIALRARPRCTAYGFTSCAIFAAGLAVTETRAAEDTAFRNSLVTWGIIAFIVLVVGGALLLAYFRRRSVFGGRTDELRAAAGHTLSLADEAVNEIEVAAPQMPPDVRSEYDRALGLRDRARTEIERASTQGMLIQANEDAAQATLALRGVMHRLGIEGALTSPLDVPARRCFYCGREDRPPYITRTIDDGRGNTMEVEICSVCAQQLAQGQTPQIATVGYSGAAVPWWAVPNNPWYYAYGGPSWQYWLPFIVGIDVGGWFAGPGLFMDPGAGWVGNDMSGAASAPTDAGGAGFGGWGDGGAMDAGPPTDAGGADFGGGDWGGDAGGGGDMGGGWG